MCQLFNSLCDTMPPEVRHNILPHVLHIIHTFIITLYKFSNFDHENVEIIQERNVHNNEVDKLIFSYC